jgi:ABC-type multidrug transport system ATPase subunit
LADINLRIYGGETVVVMGPAGAGKSTLLRQIEEKCRQDNIPVIFFNLENKPRAIEVKYDKTKFNPLKYKLFKEVYPDIPLEYLWMYPFDEDFFRRLE